MTAFSYIYKIFLSSIQDYHIRNLFNENVDVADDLLESFLIRGISHFKNCKKPLKDVDLENKCFNSDLDIDEINILAELMVLSWFDWNNNNVIQMNLNLNDNDFKHFSEEKNLREKTMYADRLREKVNQDMVDYGLYRTSFEDWAVGNYDL